MLVCWLPLTKDTNNYGLSDIAPVNSGATITSDGKLGNCYTFDGIDDYIDLGTVTLGNTWSFCFWLRRNEWLESWGRHFSFVSVNNNSTYVGMNERKTNKIQSGLHISGKFDNYYTFNLNEWYHVAMTYDGNTVSIYQNGILLERANAYGFVTGEYIGRIGSHCKLDSLDSAYLPTSCSINDFRYYDECISPKMVKEISKGLMLNYKLSGVGGENLVVNSGLYTKDNPLTSTSSSKDGIKTMKSLYMECAPGETYTFQCKTDGIWGNHKTDGTGNGCTHLYLYLQTADEVDTTSYKTPIHLYGAEYNGKTGRGVWTYTVPTTYEYVRIIFRFDIHSDGETSYTVNWWDLKAEKGTKATSWCPNKADALYSTLGLDDGMEYDCSGFGNDGEIVGNIVWDGDSPRYSGSYGFEADSNIKAVCPVSSFSQFSCSFWVKPQSGCGGYATLISDYDGISTATSQSLWLAVNTEGYGLWFFNGNYARSNKGVLSLDTWHHACFVFNNGVVTWYQDGELAGSTDISSRGTVIKINSGFLGIGNSYTGTTWNTDFVGQLSDIRIYSTALSEESIKELFQVGASVDSRGNLYASEFEEVE